MSTKPKTMTVTIHQADDTLVVGIGGQVRTLDFEDGYAEIALFEKGGEAAFLRLEFTDEMPLPKATSNVMHIDVTLPKKKEEDGE